ncbi:hypothetical protein, partial [Chryseobacterium sp. 5_R23647]|uniref:hypothetical protein n=1 Tax=Chryseobacterium sp. 5_R23647 TaxID=2258964 RepID=UPI001E643D81
NGTPLKRLLTIQVSTIYSSLKRSLGFFHNLTFQGLAMAGISKHFRSANGQKFNRSTKRELMTFRPLLPNPCYLPFLFSFR